MKNKYILFSIVGLVVLGIIAFLNYTNVSDSSLAVKATATPLGQRIKTTGCKVNGPFQDKECSPGKIIEGVTKEQVCTSGYASKTRNVPASLKEAVYAEYGITSRTKGEYEVDHIVSLELGGSNDIDNLYPQATEPRPGSHEKDKIENYLHDQVCSGKLALKDAQLIIANDWLSIYKQLYP